MDKLAFISFFSKMEKAKAHFLLAVEMPGYFSLDRALAVDDDALALHKPLTVQAVHAIDLHTRQTISSCREKLNLKNC